MQARAQAGEERAVHHRPTQYQIERVESQTGPSVAVGDDIVLVRKTSSLAADRARAFAFLKRKGLLSCDCCGIA